MLSPRSGLWQTAAIVANRTIVLWSDRCNKVPANASVITFVEIFVLCSWTIITFFGVITLKTCPFLLHVWFIVGSYYIKGCKNWP